MVGTGEPALRTGQNFDVRKETLFLNALMSVLEEPRVVVVAAAATAAAAAAAAAAVVVVVVAVVVVVVVVAAAAAAAPPAPRTRPTKLRSGPDHPR